MSTTGRAFGGVPVLLAVLLLSHLSLSLAQDQGRIAFIDPDGRVATVAPDGSELRILTEPGRQFQFPAWSPDGTTLAVIGADTAGGAVYTVADSASAEPQELYRSQEEPPFYLYWTPDGRQLGFLANHPSGIGLHIASPEDAKSRLRLTGQPFYWQWTADGEGLLRHTGFAGPGSRLTFIDAAGEGPGGDLAAPGFFQAPGISASERYIAYGAVDALGRGRLVVQSNPQLEAVEAEPVAREVGHQGLIALSWSPTADLLAFISPPGQAPYFYGPISLLDAESGLLEPLVPQLAIAFFWSPDGCCIAYFTPALRDEGGGDADDADGQQRLPLLDLAVAEVASGKVWQVATFRPSPLFIAQFLPFFDQYTLSHDIWSPASDALVLPIVDDDGITRIYVVTLTGQLHPVARGSAPVWSR
ncbi:MAG: hypothetical protein WD314_02190 [Trueperaceae bacterium]